MLVEKGYDDIRMVIVAHLSNRTVRVCAMVGIRIESRIQLVRDIARVRAHVSGARSSAAVVHIRIEARVQLVAGVGAMRTVVGGSGRRRIHAFTVSVNWRDTCTVTGSLIAVVNLMGAMGGNCCVLVDARAVTSCLVYAGIDVSTDSLACSLLRVRTRFNTCPPGNLTWTMPTPFLIASPIPVLE